MRRAIAIVVGLGLALAGSAAAEPDAKRKTAPDKFAKAASEAFVAAYAADQKGDLKVALGLYQKAFAISAHPSTIFNTADVQRRLGRLSDAITSYEMYLAIAPAAADRKAVEALIEKLAATPGSVFVITAPATDPKSINLKTAYLLFNGKLKIKPGTPMTSAVDAGNALGFELSMPPGSYYLDAVTPLTYGMSVCIVKPGERQLCGVSAPPRIDGAVVISGDDRNLEVLVERTDRHSDTRVHKRFDLPVGRTRLYVRDGQFECPPLAIDVPKGGDVSYTFIRDIEPGSRPRCRALDITRHRLHFDP